MIKGLLDIILVVIVIFFVWNILKRLFIGTVFKNFQPRDPQNRNTPKSSAEPKINQKVNWDAETIDYEEIKETDSEKK